MTDASLTADRILDAAEECLRRFGPQKTTVVDVARALEVSHGAIYRYYASKEALREAVVQRWLYRAEAPLQAIADDRGDAVKRLCAWLQHLIESKRAKLQEDPELFATYCALVKDMGGLREAILRHLTVLTAQLAHIIGDGVAQQRLAVDDANAAARAVLNATVRFHHPMLHVTECYSPATIESEYQEVLSLILAGLGLRGSAIL